MVVDRERASMTKRTIPLRRPNRRQAIQGARRKAPLFPNFSKVSNIDQRVWVAAQHTGSITAPYPAVIGD
jgi:hypothetical protein